MNSKKTFKNTELFSWVFKDQEYEHPLQFKLNMPTNYKQTVAEMMKEAPDMRISEEDYFEYMLNMEVGKTFFYFTFIHPFPYKRRIEFLNYQHATSADKMSFLHRVEALMNMDYWYAFDLPYSCYNPDAERDISEWLVAKYAGKEMTGDRKAPLHVVKTPEIILPDNKIVK